MMAIPPPAKMYRSFKRNGPKARSALLRRLQAPIRPLYLIIMNKPFLPIWNNSRSNRAR